MKLFLCSDPVVAETNVLNGDNGFIELLKKELPEKVKVLYIASAESAYEITDLYGYSFEKCLKASGINVEKYTILDSRTDEFSEKLINEADLLVLAGGHVPTQNDYFEKIDLRSKIKDYDKTIISVSAGSMNAADKVYAQPEMEGEALDENYVRYLKGLGLTDINILPHYNLVKDNYLDGMRLFEDITFKDSYGKQFLVLVDGSFVLVEKDKSVIYGLSYLIENGTIKKLSDLNETLLIR